MTSEAAALLPETEVARFQHHQDQLRSLHVVTEYQDSVKDSVQSLHILAPCI